MHWRPKHFWKPGTHVHVNIDVNGVNAGNGIYGQLSRKVHFTIGNSVIMKTNLNDHMKVWSTASSPGRSRHRRSSQGWTPAVASS